MFVLYPVTLVDELDGNVKSVWATTSDFFDFFLLRDAMKVPVPSGVYYSLTKKSDKKMRDLYLIKRDAVWSKLYGTLHGYVESDDEFFLDEIRAGFPRFDFITRLDKSGPMDRETFRQPLQVSLRPIFQ